MVLSFKDIWEKKDGVDFINVFSQGKTELGRLLSNFAHTPFKYKGKQFESVEGYWYYMVSGGDPKFYFVHGPEAKQRGKEIITRQPEPTRGELKEIYIAKLESNPHLKKLLKASSLPLAHYYQYSGPPINADKHLWTVELWDEIRSELKNMNKYEKLVGKTWSPILEPFFKSPEFSAITKHLKECADKGGKICPKFENVFQFLKNCPFDKIKAIWLIEIGLNKEDNDKIADKISEGIAECCQAYTDDSTVWDTPGVLLLPLNLTTCNGENHTRLWNPFIVHIMKALQSKHGLIYCFVGKSSRNHYLAVDQTCNDFHYIEHPMHAITNNRPWKHDNIFEKVNRASQFLNDKKIW